MTPERDRRRMYHRVAAPRPRRQELNLVARLAACFWPETVTLADLGRLTKYDDGRRVG